MKDPVFSSTSSGDQIININWASTIDQETMNKGAIELLCKYMSKDKTHNKDFLFLPLVALVKDYLQYPLDFDIPEELENNIDRMQKIIVRIEELMKTKERIDIDFYQFSGLLSDTIQQIDGIQNAMEDISNI